MFVPVAALVLLAGGCGGGHSSPPLTKAEYVKQVTQVRQGIEASLGTLTTLSGAPAAAVAVGKVQEEMRTAAKQLEAISPPTEIAAEHEKLTTGVSDFADELDPLIAKLKQGNLQALSTLPNLHGFLEVRAAAIAITKAGYPISN